MDAAQPSRRDLTRTWGTGGRLSALLAGFAFRLLPQRRRFGAAVATARLAARLLAPALRRRGYVGTVAAPADATVRVLCRAMTAAGTRFDPIVRWDGPEDLAGALLVSGHFPLNALVTRALFDRGLPPAVVKRVPLADPYYWGSFVRDEVVTATPDALLRIRGILRTGRPAFIDIDSSAPVPRGITVETARGIQYVSTAAFDFARRAAVPLYFACARSEKSGPPLVYVRRIETVEEFIAHLQEQVGNIV